MTVSWDPPAIDQRNGNITYYRAILTPLQAGGEKIVKNVLAAATMKGIGPYSPVLSIDPDPASKISF
ncbi:unnamed protein product [Gongylonema pulchrum]|uniref:Fibronectin type-III domain-containing protein n=1 Tax=Gongylonema pulchrum TaxID=637853 RepID=A0A183D9R8_9BILA|nr:unnamed protein product [Gongylonema pulchrum]